MTPCLPVVLLHGFTQTGAAWDGVRAALGNSTVLTPDLRGHGESATHRPIDTEHLVTDVLASSPARFVLGGYSMGGRLALHVALAAPERVLRLVLVSTTAGIEKASERAARRAADEQQATVLERDGIATWSAQWASSALFAGAPPQAQEMRLAQNPAGLAASLRGFGAGTMPAVWDRLSELSVPAVILAGENDEKFGALGQRLAAALPTATLTVVPGVGHVLPLQAPAAVAAALCD